MHYKEAYERLNKSQKIAVDSIDGPLMVIAGPGTGKTQILATRVATILQKTDVDASSILCLTFTNKAAINMRQRILELTDNNAAGVNVKTFHSFASEIINSYPDYFWNSARLSMAPDALQRNIVQNVLKSLPLDHPLALKFAGKYTLTDDVINALKLVKEAGLTPEKLRTIIKLNIAYIDQLEPSLIEITSNRLSHKKLQDLTKAVESLHSQSIDNKLSPLISLSTVILESLQNAIKKDEETGKTSQTSKWKSRWIQTVDSKKGMHTERARNIWWLELAGVYEKYRQELHSGGYFDYADLIVEVIAQIENHPDLHSAVQERFNHVMIDEFQDTNSAQFRLAQLVANHPTQEDKPNIMAVGDDDQSIFKFNGAELGNMLGFMRSYPAAKTVVLQDNYRSSQTILDVSETIINKSVERLVDLDPSLDKHLVAKSSIPVSTVQSLRYTDRESQLSGVAKDIQKHYSKNKSIAVLARGHASLRNIAARLFSLNVPIHYEQQQNALENPLVKQVLYILDAIVAVQKGDIASCNVALSKTLAHPMWGISTEDLYKIAIESRKNNEWLSEISSDKETLWIAKLIQNIARISAYEPLPVTIEYILGLRSIQNYSSPIKEVFSNDNANEYLYGLSSIQYIRRLAAEYSGTSEPTFDNFVEYLRIERENENNVTDQSVFVSGNHAVNLLTIHKAKGLEFDSVYIIDAVENIWQPRKGGRKPPANLPLQPVGDNMDDYARLMYVAATRAKQNLYIASYSHDDLGNETLTSSLISGLPLYDLVTPVEPIKTLEQALSWPKISTNKIKPLLTPILANYSLSVTHLLNYLDVTKGGPTYFFEKNILRIPEAKSSSMAFGTAMHDALEQAQKDTNNNTYSYEKILQSFDKSLVQESMETSEFERYRTKGRKLLQSLLKEIRLTIVKGATAEQKISDIYVGDARLGGKLDNVLITEDQIIVTDYKTGRPLSSFQSNNANLQVKAWRQKTQLIYYALLIRNHSRFKEHSNKRIIGQMVYLEADTKEKMTVTYEPTASDIEELKSLIEHVWSKIQKLDLPNTSSYTQNIDGINKFHQDLLKN